ncbi:hypothetical protein GGX14DRAFT_406266 [Mycena pura]|uniref:Uncharacterized protein n=1 Tax=Mycena pura TaxID=153505 RepID=A0AAD6UUF9_9AGAR|nr:hypothetical protein GGX14DRAFT_406266 [Mycena pura]
MLNLGPGLIAKKGNSYFIFLRVDFNCTFVRNLILFGIRKSFYRILLRVCAGPTTVAQLPQQFHPLGYINMSLAQQAVDVKKTGLIDVGAEQPHSGEVYKGLIEHERALDMMRARLDFEATLDRQRAQAEISKALDVARFYRDCRRLKAHLRALEDTQVFLHSLRQRRRIASWMFARWENDRFARLTGALDKALDVFSTSEVVKMAAVFRNNDKQLTAIVKTLHRLEDNGKQGELQPWPLQAQFWSKFFEKIECYSPIWGFGTIYFDKQYVNPL